MQSKIMAIGAFLSVAFAGTPLLAHHAFTAEFDATQPIVLKGTITKMEWINPHSWIYLDVKNNDGSTTNWAVEAGAPNAMFRRGWNMNSIQVGTEVVIDGYRAKNGKNIANGKEVTLPDGKKLFVGSTGTGAPYEEKKP
jgi:hypothetical protein